jgi:anti-sigma regulatory factor (Ser/Thr protein kinase)
MRAITVKDPSQVAEARRGAVTVAQGLGFGEEDAGRVAIVATELATNMLKHGAGGELLVASYEDRTGAGVECLALDQGPGHGRRRGIVARRALDGGQLRHGLGAIARGSHVVDIYSRPGLGTAILVRLQQGRPGSAAPSPEPVSGAVSLPKPGEEACGDAWCRRAHASGFKLMVADGLGHGPLAAQAAHGAVRVFLTEHASRPGTILERMHQALRSTRGAAVSVADVDVRGGSVVFAGIGNVAGVLIAEDGTARRMVSHNGTVGHVAKRVQEFTYAFEGAPLVILYSDGLGTSWSLEAYPGLTKRHPTLIAGVLYRDFKRGRDDVTVLVARGEPT